MLEFETAVVQQLRTDGFDASLDYPGIVTIVLDDSTFVATGLHGFEYGTIYRKTAESGTYFPTNSIDVDLGIMSLTAEEVAALWGYAVEMWRESK